MRYKELITRKLESLDNSINGINSLLSQSATREQYDTWFALIKEKIQDIQTLINSESDSQQGTW